MIDNRIFTIRFLLVLALVLTGGSAWAWKGAYEGEDLEKLRTWEKEWVGKTVNKENVGQLKDLLLPTFVDIIKDQETFGPITLEVTPYQKYEYPAENVYELSEKYRGKCKIGPEGDLLNYVAGIPFPEPKNADEIMWNFNKRFLGDDSFGLFYNDLVNRQHRQRSTRWDWGKTFFQPRYVLPPFDNPRGIHYVENTGIQEPPDIRGMYFITVRYINSLTEDDAWLYIPTMRRFRRISVAQRSDSAGGADWTWDDYSCDSRRIPTATYKLLGQRELLFTRHQDHLKLKHEEGQIYMITEGKVVERMKVYEIEIVSKDPNYNYSKKIVYIDPESWGGGNAVMYDKKGKLWKYGEWGMGILPGSHHMETNCGGVIDLQRKHSSGYNASENFRGGIGRPADVANLDYWRARLH